MVLDETRDKQSILAEVVVDSMKDLLLFLTCSSSSSCFLLLHQKKTKKQERHDRMTTKYVSQITKRTRRCSRKKKHQNRQC